MLNTEGNHFSLSICVANNKAITDVDRSLINYKLPCPSLIGPIHLLDLLIGQSICLSIPKDSDEC